MKSQYPGVEAVIEAAGRKRSFGAYGPFLFPGLETTRNVAEAIWRLPSWTEQAIRLMDRASSGAIDPRTGEIDTEGAGTEIYPEARAGRELLVHRPTTEDLQQFYGEHRHVFEQYRELRVGWDRTCRGWELNIAASTTDKAACSYVARRLDQRAAWDIRKRAEITVGGKGEQTGFPGYPLAERLRDLRRGTSFTEMKITTVIVSCVGSTKPGREQ